MRKLSLVLSAALILLLACTFSACGRKKSDSSDPPLVVTSDCPANEDLSTIASTVTAANGELISQTAFINGIVGASTNLSKLRVYMTSNGLTAITLNIYSYSAGNPDTGTLLGTSTINTGLGSALANTPMEFTISPPLALTVSNSYAFIVSATGGGFTMSYSNPQLVSSGLFDKKSGGTWNMIAANSSLAMFLTYSGCSGM